MILIKNYEKFLKTVKAQGPITTPQIFFGKTESFHPQGLFSEDIFGIDGSRERSNSFSWIELNAPIIHPTMHDILKKRIFMKINKLLSGEVSFSIDSNGYLIEDPNGEIDGMMSFVENIKKIRFQKTEYTKKEMEKMEKTGEFENESDRDKIINNIYERIKDDTFFMRKLIVISPSSRTITKDPDTDEWIIDDLNAQYQKIITASNQIKNVHGSLFNAMAYRLQMLIRDLNDILKSYLGQKYGLIRNNMLGKRADFSARAVIVPNPNISVGYVGMPLRNACMLFEPFILHGLINSAYSKKIPDEFHIAVKEFLNKESFI